MTDIRKTLANAKAATFAVLLPGAQSMSPVGTGFFVSPDGWFITAAHVVQDQNGAARTGLNEARLMKEPELASPGAACQWPVLDWLDRDLDVAILRVDFGRNANKAWLVERTEFPFLQVSSRLLDEGEGVYAYGYPLPSSQSIVRPGITISLNTLRPRVTSAIVAAQREEYGPVMTGNDPVRYVLDKALNYGNSGGPIVATDTGHAHAICARFQPVSVPQSHLKDNTGKPLHITVPSLYGIASGLSTPRLLKALGGRGVPIVGD